MGPHYNVLITNLLIAQRTGTEVVVELLVDGLRRHGHTPIVFAPTLGRQAERLREAGTVIVDRLSALPLKPDVIHGHHNAPTMAAIAAFPDVPAIFVSHSVASLFDRPPLHPRIFRYLAVSDFVAQRCISDGVPANKLGRFQNAVDLARFGPRAPLPARPTSALAIVKQPERLPYLRAACAERGLTLQEIGHGIGRVEEHLEHILPSYDLVFATGRCALEAIAVGCALILSDGNAFGGFVSGATVDHLNDRNFGVSVLPFLTTRDKVLEAIDAYDQVGAEEATTRIRELANLDAQIPALVELYQAALSEPAVSRDEENAAIAAFIEDFVPTFARDRPWRALVRAMEERPDALTARLDAITTALLAVTTTLQAVQAAINKPPGRWNEVKSRAAAMVRMIVTPPVRRRARAWLNCRRRTENR